MIEKRFSRQHLRSRNDSAELAAILAQFAATGDSAKSPNDGGRTSFHFGASADGSSSVECGAALFRGLDKPIPSLVFTNSSMNATAATNSMSATPSSSSRDRTIPALAMIDIINKFQELDSTGVLSSNRELCSPNEILGLIVTEALHTMEESDRIQARDMLCDYLSTFLALSVQE